MEIAHQETLMLLAILQKIFKARIMKIRCLKYMCISTVKIVEGKKSFVFAFNYFKIHPC